MALNIYSQISKQTGKDVRLVRAAAHHPFEFLTQVMVDPKDHRPMRLRYLGAFFVKPYWRKGLKRAEKIGVPEDGVMIWARVPEHKFNKTYMSLKFGFVNNGIFTSDDGNVVCPVSDVQFWTKVS